MRPVLTAARGKGIRNLVRRSWVIGSRYGVSSRRMEKRLSALQRIVEAYRCGATLPVTMVAARRNGAVIRKYAELGIEFAVHGYYHVDHKGLSLQDQREQLGRARHELEAYGLRASGFRAPYLRANEATIQAVRENGYEYDSSQAFAWPVDERIQTEAYRRGLEFCSAMSATDYPVLPWSEDGVIRIPCSLPDDESMIDRLHLSESARRELWVSILQTTIQQGELFALALHPERIDSCLSALVAVLETATKSRPPVWRARLQEVADWWRARYQTSVQTHDAGSGRLRIDVHGPNGLTVLARGIDLPGDDWADGYVRVRETQFEVQTARRPFVAVHPSSDPSLSTFLHEQGYIVETADSPDAHSYFLHRERFLRADQRRLVAELEAGQLPLLRLARWPGGARSALSITGDVDALTIWDYVSRLIGG